MSWEYRALRRRLGLPDTEWSVVFDDFCTEVAPTTEGRLEWSVRRTPDRLLTDRFVWSGANSPAISRSLERLEEEGWFVPERLGTPADLLRAARAEWSTAISLGYTPGDRSVGEWPGMKLYLTISRRARSRAWPWIRGFLPSLPEQAPPNDVDLILAFADDQKHTVQPRLYLLCDGIQMSPYLLQWLEPGLLALGGEHVRSGVVVRHGGADCFGCAFQPAGIPAPAPNAAYSRLLPAILETIRGCPPAWERVGRMTWATYALTQDARPKSDAPRNVYFLLR